MREFEFVMKVTDQSGEVFFLLGDDEQDAVTSFGAGIEIQHGKWTPLTKEI